MTSTLVREIEAYDEWRWDNREVCGWCDGVAYWEANGEVSDDDYARHESCRKAIAERTCNNPQCKEYGTCFVDYQLGAPCEFCGAPLGVTQ